MYQMNTKPNRIVILYVKTKENMQFNWCSCAVRFSTHLPTNQHVISPNRGLNKCCASGMLSMMAAIIVMSNGKPHA